MCVHVFCAEEMPDKTLVWVKRQLTHIVVYADGSLATASGKLRPEGVAEINRALSTLPGAPSLESAKPCG